eukprot:4966833-Lingulodinium_polyedra.AAC.1
MGRRSGSHTLLARSTAGTLTRHCSRDSRTISGFGHDRQHAVAFSCFTLGTQFCCDSLQGGLR